jgi:serine phosphatase RsbU (regulator of sigma subunit)/PAS domain-containing protein
VDGQPAAAGSPDVPASEPAEALAAVVAKLRAELAGVRTAMRNRAVIEQAKGVLVERLGITPDEGFDQLVRLSQRSNVKLVEVAAAIVGTTAPDPQAPAVSELIDDELREHVARTRARATPARPREPARAGRVARGSKGARQLPPVDALRAQHQLLCSRIATAHTLDEVAEAIRVAAAAWPQPATTIVTVLEADGAQRLAGASGVSPQVRSQWSRMPPDVDVPVTVAVRNREPILLPDPATVRRHFPHLQSIPVHTEALFATPLQADGRIVGVLGLSWAEPLRADEDTRRYLAQLADPVTRKVIELTGDSAAEEAAKQPAQDWLQLVLESLHHAGMLLDPVSQDGLVTDFRMAYINGLARGLLASERVDLTDATLLSVFPGIGSRVLLPAFARVLRTGEFCRLEEVAVDSAVEGTITSYLITVHACRLWDRVLVIWRVHSAADVLHDQLLHAERIASIGSFSWDLHAGEPLCSPELYRLLFGDQEPGRVNLDELAACVHTDDLLAVHEAVRRSLVHGKHLTVEFRGANQLAGRRLRLTAEPVMGEDGEVATVRGTVQDVTEERALESRLRLAEEALAAQRRRMEAELHAARALQQALLPSEPELGTAQGLAVRGRCRATERTGRVDGDWYDVYPLPDGATVLVVGDVAGSGLAAMTAAARLRYAVRAYAALDLGPADVLMAVNAMLCRLEPERTATLTVARFEPARRQLRWAAAGRAAPVRIRRSGRASVLPGELGLPVGANADARYAESRVTLLGGDRMMLYTDALIGGRDAELIAAIDALSRLANDTDLDDTEGIVEHIVRALHGRPDEDMCAVLMRIVR